MSGDEKYIEIKPKLNRYMILRYAEPDPPLIYNRKTNELIKAKSYKVLDILKYCNGSNTIGDISKNTGVKVDSIYSLLKKFEILGWIYFE